MLRLLMRRVRIDILLMLMLLLQPRCFPLSFPFPFPFSLPFPFPFPLSHRLPLPCFPLSHLTIHLRVLHPILRRPNRLFRLPSPRSAFGLDQ